MTMGPGCPGVRAIRNPCRTTWRVLIRLFVVAAPALSAVASAQPPPPSASVESFIDAGNLVEAQAALRSRIEADGETSRNLLLRGLILYREERYDQALVDLQRSFRLDERNPNTSKALGLCLVRMGREELAETFFEISVGLAPTDPMAHYYLGLNAYTTKRFERAAALFERSVSLDPHSVDGQSFLGRSYEALGQVELAAVHYAEANDLNRKNEQGSATPPLLLGTLLYRQSKLDQAEQHLREALSYDETSSRVHYWLGLILERRFSNEAAIRELTRAAALAPEDHRPHYALARIHRKTGNHLLAAEAVRRFRELRARSEVETF